MPEPNMFFSLVKEVGIPVAILVVVGFVFLKMTQKQSDELSETHKWIRETMLGVQRDTSAVVARCESTLGALLHILDKRDSERKERL